MMQGHERPVNASAARVVSRGENFQYKGLETEICSPTPLALNESRPDGEDFTGARFGRLTVVGWIGEGKGKWSCKCICGNYVVRRAKAIRQAAEDSSCQQCYLMAVSKKKEFLRRTGIERHTREFLL